MKFEGSFLRFSCQCAIAGLTFATLSTVAAPRAIADDQNFPTIQGVRFGQIPYEFENTFFSNTGDYYKNRSLGGQLQWLFGPFPENSMNRDSKAIHKLYLQTQYRQMNSGPIVRTLDLPTPFPYSLRTQPAPIVAAPIDAGPVFVEPPVAPPAPLTPPPQKPVPGLW